MISLFDLVVLLCAYDKQLVFSILSRKDMHFSVVEGAFDDMQLEWGKGRESEVAHLSDLILSGLYG